MKQLGGSVGIKFYAKDGFTKKVDLFQRRIDRFTQKSTTAFTKMNAKMKGFGGGLSGFGGGGLGSLGALGGTYAFVDKSFSALADFQHEMTNVQRTTNLTGREMDSLTKKTLQFLDATNNSFGFRDIGQYLSAAGRTGIIEENDTSDKKMDKLIRFAEVMSKLELTSDGGIGGEQGAMDLSRLFGLTGAKLEDYKVFASMITSLGNSTKAKESEILEGATSIAGKASAHDLSYIDSIVLATVGATVGMQPERLGSNVSLLMRQFKNITGSDPEKNQRSVHALGSLMNLEMDGKSTKKIQKDLKKMLGKEIWWVFSQYAKGINILKQEDPSGIKLTQLQKLASLDATGMTHLSSIANLRGTNSLEEIAARASKEKGEGQLAIDREYKIAMKTLKQSIKRMGNSFDMWAIKIDLMANATGVLTSVFDGISGNISWLGWGGLTLATGSFVSILGHVGGWLWGGIAKIVSASSIFFWMDY